MDKWTQPPMPANTGWGSGDWCTWRPEKLVMALAALAGAITTLVAAWVMA